MVQSLRSLQGRIGEMRPDLKDATVYYWMQEVLREIGRKTFLFKETQVPVVLPALADTMTVTPSNGNNILRVELVRIARGLFQQAAYQGTWNATTNTPTITTGTASASNVGQFYIVTTAGTTTVDGTSTWNVGDIIQSSGAVWTRFDRESLITTSEVTQPVINVGQYQPQEPTGTVTSWAQTIQNPTGTIIFYPRSLYDSVIEVTLSYIPVGELTNLGTLPDEVEDCITQGTLAKIMMLPSQREGMQNFMIAKDYDMKFQRSLASLMNKGLYGFGGSNVVIPPSFTGTYGTKAYWILR